MIGCWCEAGFVAKIDRARGSQTRSHFCREAIAEKLRALGVEVRPGEAASPDRTGKGGPRSSTYRLRRYRAQLNEAVAKTSSRSKQTKE